MFDKLEKIRLSTILMLVFGGGLLLVLLNWAWSEINFSANIDSSIVSKSWDWALSNLTLIVTVTAFVVTAFVVMKGFRGRWGKPSPTAEFIYVSVVAGLVGYAILVSSLGAQWLGDPFLKFAFDERSNPQYMMYDDAMGNPTRAKHQTGELEGQFIRPSYCRDGADHQGFIYEKMEGCGSPIDGSAKLRPVKRSDVPAANLRTVWDAFWTLVWGPTTNGDEAKAAKAESAQASRKITKTDCEGDFAKLERCRVYSVSKGTEFTIPKKMERGWCVTWVDPQDGPQLTEIYDGPSGIRVRANRDLVIPIWHIRDGEINNGFTCVTT